MANPIPGNPQTVTATCYKADGVTSLDPLEVKWSLAVTGTTTPIVTVFKYGVDPAVGKTGPGIYTLAFVPDRPGLWTATLDGFDGAGNHVCAGEWSVQVDPRHSPLPVA